jgi:hypothetical protein
MFTLGRPYVAMVCLSATRSSVTLRRSQGLLAHRTTELYVGSRVAPQGKVNSAEARTVRWQGSLRRLFRLRLLRNGTSLAVRTPGGSDG